MQFWKDALSSIYKVSTGIPSPLNHLSINYRVILPFTLLLWPYERYVSALSVADLINDLTYRL